MPNLPADKGSLVKNTETGFLSGQPDPTWTEFNIPSDAARLPSGKVVVTKPNHYAADHVSPSVETPVEFISIASTSIDAPQNPKGPDVNVLKEDFWMDRGSYPTSN